MLRFYLGGCLVLALTVAGARDIYASSDEAATLEHMTRVIRRLRTSDDAVSDFLADELPAPESINDPYVWYKYETTRRDAQVAGRHIGATDDEITRGFAVLWSQMDPDTIKAPPGFVYPLTWTHPEHLRSHPSLSATTFSEAPTTNLSVSTSAADLPTSTQQSQIIGQQVESYKEDSSRELTKPLESSKSFEPRPPHTTPPQALEYIRNVTKPNIHGPLPDIREYVLDLKAFSATIASKPKSSQMDEPPSNVGFETLSSEILKSEGDVVTQAAQAEVLEPIPPSGSHRSTVEAEENAQHIGQTDAAEYDAINVRADSRSTDNAEVMIGAAVGDIDLVNAVIDDDTKESDDGAVDETDVSSALGLLNTAAQGEARGLAPLRYVNPPPQVLPLSTPLRIAPLYADSQRSSDNAILEGYKKPHLLITPHISNPAAFHTSTHAPLAPPVDLQFYEFVEEWEGKTSVTTIPPARVTPDAPLKGQWFPLDDNYSMETKIGLAKWLSRQQETNADFTTTEARQSTAAPFQIANLLRPNLVEVTSDLYKSPGRYPLHGHALEQPIHHVHVPTDTREAEWLPDSIAEQPLSELPEELEEPEEPAHTNTSEVSESVAEIKGAELLTPTDLEGTDIESQEQSPQDGQPIIDGEEVEGQLTKPEDPQTAEEFSSKDGGEEEQLEESNHAEPEDPDEHVDVMGSADEPLDLFVSDKEIIAPEDTEEVVEGSSARYSTGLRISPVQMITEDNEPLVVQVGDTRSETTYGTIQVVVPPPQPPISQQPHHRYALGCCAHGERGDNTDLVGIVAEGMVRRVDPSLLIMLPFLLLLLLE